MAVAGNQQPVVVTWIDGDGFTHITRVQPLVALDGGDGSRISAAVKTADDVWHPMRALVDAASVAPAPATRTTTTADDTAVIAAGLAKV